MKHNTQPQESKEHLGITPDPDELQLLADFLFAKKEELIAAYDNTYRKGYNPTQVDALYKAAQEMVTFFQQYVPLQDHNGKSLHNDWDWNEIEQALKNAKL